MRFLIGTRILHPSIVKRKITDKKNHQKVMKFVKRGKLLLSRKKVKKRHLHTRKLPVNAFYGIKLSKRLSMRKGSTAFRPLLKINKKLI